MYCLVDRINDTMQAAEEAKAKMKNQEQVNEEINNQMLEMVATIYGGDSQ